MDMVWYRYPHPRRWRGMAHWQRSGPGVCYRSTYCSGWPIPSTAIGVSPAAVAPEDRCGAAGCGARWRTWIAEREARRFPSVLAYVRGDA